MTYQESEAETGMSWHPEGYALPFFETPELLFNGELYWSKWGWDSYVSYNYQSEFLEDYEDFNNNPYEQPYEFVDLSVKYNVTDYLQASFEELRDAAMGTKSAKPKRKRKKRAS